MDLSIVVPIYNEVESLPLLCEKLHSTLAPLGHTYEIVFVDDGSTDGTWALLLEMVSKYPHIHVIRLRANFGQTAAMSAGFRESTGNVVITMDADLQNDPADIPRLLKRMEDEQCDVVSGWRRRRKDAFIHRRLPSMIANKLISKITGVHLHDYGCTLKAYQRDVIKDVHLYGEMHRFIPALASWVGGKVDEVEVEHHARLYGTSKYGISRTIRVVLDLLTVKFLLHYSKGPMQIFGKFGLAFGLPGLAMMTFMVLTHLSYQIFGTEFGAWLVKRPMWIMGSLFLIFCGIQFILMGLLAEIQIRTWHESQDRPVYVIREIIKSPPAS